MSASDRVRARLREELDKRHISQRVLAKALTERDRSGESWTQSRAAKVITGRVRLLVDDAELVAEVAGVSLLEALRERGNEWCADLTPSEFVLLEQYRALPAGLQGALTMVAKAAATGQSKHIRDAKYYRGHVRPGATPSQPSQSELMDEVVRLRTILTELAQLAGQAATGLAVSLPPTKHQPKSRRA